MRATRWEKSQKKKQKKKNFSLEHEKTTKKGTIYIYIKNYSGEYSLVALIYIH